jgi:hypothetical protein
MMSLPDELPGRFSRGLFLRVYGRIELWHVDGDSVAAQEMNYK